MTAEGTTQTSGTTTGRETDASASVTTRGDEGDTGTSTTSATSSSESGDVDPTGCGWSRSLPGWDARALVTLHDGTLVAAGMQGDEMLLRGLNTAGEETFSHSIDPADHAGGPTNGNGVQDVAARGEDELVVAIGGGVVSLQPSTAIVHWWHGFFDLDPTDPFVFIARIERVAVSPLGAIAVQGYDQSWPYVRALRLDPATGDFLWEESFENPTSTETPRGIVVDDGPLGVLVGTQPDGLGVPGFALMRRYAFETGVPQPAFFTQYDDAFTHFVTIHCMQLLADGNVLVVVEGPNEYGADIQRWSPGGELVTSTDSETQIRSCEIAADGVGGAFLLAEGLAEADRVWRVSETGELDLLLEDAADTRLDITADDEGEFAVLRTSASGAASVRRYCL